jgi:hypothetical protein
MMQHVAKRLHNRERPWVHSRTKSPRRFQIDRAEIEEMQGRRAVFQFVAQLLHERHGVLPLEGDIAGQQVRNRQVGAVRGLDAGRDLGTGRGPDRSRWLERWLS